MASIVFVHGSGIRAERYARMVLSVEQGLHAAGSTDTVVPCSWGEERGSRLLAGGASLRGIGSGEGTRGGAPRVDSAGGDDPEVDAQIVDPELAAWAMADHEADQEADRQADAEAGPEPDLQTGPASRWSQVTATLHFRPGGLRLGTSLLGTPLLGTTLLGASLRHGSLQEQSSAFTGDIALYLARGTAIRDSIREVIAAAEPPVTVLAHSLGAVATVDLLVDKPMPEVELLVTVGTQVGFLYEIDALPSLRFGESLPESFPRWVNVLDRRDALAYLTEPLFPGRSVDKLVDNRAPFPLAHTAYFGNSRFYRLVVGLA